MSERHIKNERFVVVENATGRASCWPVARAVPEGWITTAISGTKQQCLDAIGSASQTAASATSDGLRMSMMFFGDSESDPRGDKYRLLMESARFADRNGLAGLWLPERHFTRFGCLYPSPSVLHAALSRETTSLKLRAGSVVLPLNDPVRVAEEWSVVDNLSGGRVEIAFASGWHPDDFALKPEAYRDRVARMNDDIGVVQSLWRGEKISRLNGAGKEIEIRTYPTPIQKEVPVWLTAAGNPETFRSAGAQGHGVLTHLFHQDITELAEKVRIYHSARRRAGHDVNEGRVAVTLHTFVANTIDQVHQQAGEAYCDYLRSNLGLLNQLAFSQGQSAEVESLPREEFDDLLQWMLNKFVGGRSLMGTLDSCAATCQELASIGVNEVVCLLDFGPETDNVLANLPYLAKLNERLANMTVQRSV